MKLLITIVLATFCLPIFAQHVSQNMELALRGQDYTKLKEVMTTENLTLESCFKQESIFIKIITNNNVELFNSALQDAQINATCGDKSPLMYAVLAYNEKMVKALLENGANKSFLSKEELTAKQYAEKTQYKPVLELFK